MFLQFLRNFYSSQYLFSKCLKNFIAVKYLLMSLENFMAINFFHKFVENFLAVKKILKSLKKI